MINAVGLQGPGVEHLAGGRRCRRSRRPARRSSPASGVVRSTTIGAPRSMLAAAPAGVVAVEVNLSCPNLEGRRASSPTTPSLSAEVIAATAALRPAAMGQAQRQHRPGRRGGRVGRRGRRGGGDLDQHPARVWCIDPDTRRAGAGRRRRRLTAADPIHPVAVRTVYDVHAAIPDLPIVGVGGVSTAWDAAELMLAGARRRCRSARPTFADPRATDRIQAGVARLVQLSTV